MMTRDIANVARLLKVKLRSAGVDKDGGRGVNSSAAGVSLLALGSAFLVGCSSLGGSLGNALIASDEPTGYYDRLSRGVYAVVGMGPSRMEPDTSQVDGWKVDDRVEPAGQVTLGADLTKHLSVEVHAADLGSAGLSQGTAGPGGRINYHTSGLSALLYAGGNRDRYRRQGLKPYARLGVGSLKNSSVGDVPFDKVNGTHLLLGAGLEYMTPIGVGIRAEGVSFDKDAQYAQVGLMYRMGRKQRIERPKLAQAPKPAPIPEVAAAVPPPMPAANPCVGISGKLEGVRFRTDSASLTSESNLILDEVVYTLRQCSSAVVEVSAHTDSIGTASYNQSLSERRARSVVDYLSGRGVNTSRLNTTAFGESSPIDSNATPEGRARNRRVEIFAR